MNSLEKENFSTKFQWIMKRQFLLDKLSELQCRSQDGQEESQSMMKRFSNICKSLEFEMENVEKSRVTMEQLEGLQKSFDEYQAHVQHNVGRLQNNFQKMQERVKALEKSRKEDLHPSLVQSIQSLKCCPTVPEMKANSNTVSEYSSDLISVLNDIGKSNTCSPAMSWVLQITAETLENFNKAFQGHCKKVTGVKAVKKRKPLTLPQVKEPGVQEAQSKGLPLKRPVTTLEKTPKDQKSPSADNMFPQIPVKSFALSNKTQSVQKTKVCMESKDETRQASFNEMAKEEQQSPAPLGIHHPSPPVKSFDLPQIPVEEAYLDSLLRTGTSFEETAQKDLLSSSTLNTHDPSTTRSFDLPQIPVEEAKAHLDSKLRTGTSFEDTAQKDLPSASTRNTYRPSTVRSFDLPQIPVEEAKVYLDSKLKTGTLFEETAQKDLLNSSTLNTHRPSAARSFHLPQIPVEEAKAYFDSKLRTGTSFEETAQKDLLSSSTINTHRPSTVKSFDLPQIQSVEETKGDVVPVEDLQSPSPVHTHLSSIKEWPRIQKPSLKTPDKPKKNKHVSAVSRNSKEDDNQLLHNQMLVIDIRAQENNLKHLDHFFENNNISSETYNQCKGNISQALQSVDLRLGCLLQRYIRRVQVKQLGKTLEENFKVTRDLKDGLEFKKVHSQLCKFDHFQKSVRKIWDAKQTSTDETRRWCILRMANVYQQVNSTHGLHLTGISHVQRHIQLPLLTVTPVRFSSAKHVK